MIHIFKIAGFLVLTLGFFACGNVKQTNADGLVSDIDSLFSIEGRKPLNGIVLIDRNGITEYLKIEGYSDIENQVPVDMNSQFVIGSVSKQFTAVVALQEYDKGNIDLFSPIRNYLPELSQKWADTVNVHHLLTHTHGIDALDKPTLFKVGSQYDYSQIGYDLLAKISENVSGRSFAELTSDLFSKCGMSHTFHPDVKEYKNLAKGYIEDEGGKLNITDRSLNQYPAAGAFISTTNDLILWNKSFYGGKLLKDETFKLLTTKQEKAVRDHPIFGHTEYGYGITVDDKDNLIQWGQTGYAPGFVSMSFYFPETKTSAVVLQNICYDVDDIKNTFFYHSSILDIVRKRIQNEKSEK